MAKWGRRSSGSGQPPGTGLPSSPGHGQDTDCRLRKCLHLGLCHRRLTPPWPTGRAGGPFMGQPRKMKATQCPPLVTLRSRSRPRQSSNRQSHWSSAIPGPLGRSHVVKRTKQGHGPLGPGRQASAEAEKGPRRQCCPRGGPLGWGRNRSQGLPAGSRRPRYKAANSPGVCVPGAIPRGLPRPFGSGQVHRECSRQTL